MKMKKAYTSPEAEVVAFNLTEATNNTDDGVTDFTPSNIGD